MKNLFLLLIGIFSVPADSYRKVSDFNHLSRKAKTEKLYTKRIPLNKKEERILKFSSNYVIRWKYYLLYYIVGISCFFFWFSFGTNWMYLGMFGMALEFYYFIRMDWNFEDRIQYVRENPVKTITEVHNEHRYMGLKMSLLTLVLTVCIGFLL
ncbi:hypothetical protein [Vibrio algivorus]|uniref:Uncharacterized protein n=1 Tax=Vibrio algivorus TaxID=1667024 RepID=A0A557NUW8_9VIBR|nr:hypothetical protein [Vibrio algivorus]TVO32115.1 hypothetical protein FOF44_17500 [Vibrio algivorus]